MNTPKDRKLAIAEAVKILDAQRDTTTVSGEQRWAYFAEETASYWSVTDEAMVSLIEYVDAAKMANTSCAKAEEEWAENDETAIEIGRKLPRGFR